jgi:uncharacterized OB-fold protein
MAKPKQAPTPKTRCPHCGRAYVDPAAAYLHCRTKVAISGRPAKPAPADVEQESTDA